MNLLVAVGLTFVAVVQVAKSDGIYYLQSAVAFSEDEKVMILEGGVNQLSKADAATEKELLELNADMDFAVEKCELQASSVAAYFKYLLDYPKEKQNGAVPLRSGFEQDVPWKCVYRACVMGLFYGEDDQTAALRSEIGNRCKRLLPVHNAIKEDEGVVRSENAGKMSALVGEPPQDVFPQSKRSSRTAELPSSTGPTSRVKSLRTRTATQQ